MPPYFFHKNIIPKELVTLFVQRYHSTEFNEQLMKTAEYVIEIQLTLHPVIAPTRLGGIRACSILLLK